jgi:hypothetical protein
MPGTITIRSGGKSAKPKAKTAPKAKAAPKRSAKAAAKAAPKRPSKKAPAKRAAAPAAATTSTEAPTRRASRGIDARTEAKALKLVLAAGDRRRKAEIEHKESVNALHAAASDALAAGVSMSKVSDASGISRQWLYKMGEYNERGGATTVATHGPQSNGATEEPVAETVTRVRRTAKPKAAAKTTPKRTAKKPAAKAAPAVKPQARSRVRIKV